MWWNRHRTLMMAIGVALAAFLLVVVAVLPIYRNAGSILSKTRIKTKELDSLTSKVSILSKLDPGILEQRVAVLDSALPPRKDVLLYLSAIEGLSRELGLTFGGLSLAPGDVTEATGSAKKSVKSAGLQSLETEIKMQGGQESIYAFLRSIENVLPLMQIKDIKVSILGNDQYSLSLNLGMLWAEPATLDVKGSVTLFGADEDKYFSELASYRKFEAVGTTTVAPSGKQDLFAPYKIEETEVIPLL